MEIDYLTIELRIALQIDVVKNNRIVALNKNVIERSLYMSRTSTFRQSLIATSEQINI